LAALACGAACATVVAACSAGGGNVLSTPAGAPTAPPTSGGAPSTSAEVDEVVATVAVEAATTTATTAPTTAGDVVLDYVGAASDTVPADSTSAPVVIGYVNEEGGVQSFPEATMGATAAVDHVNAALGGAQGRPLELHTCRVVGPADGARCAAELVADDQVSVVLVGTISREAVSGPLLDGLRGRKPVVLANPLTTREFVADDAYAFTPGPPGVVQGMSIFAGRYLPEGPPSLVVVAHADTLAGRAAYSALAQPALDALGVASIGIPVGDAATGDQVAAALAAAGATEADAVVVLTPMSGCIAVDDALARLGGSVPVVASELCRGDEMAAHLAANGQAGEVPDGWYFGGTGYSYAIPGNPEIDAYVAGFTDYARGQGRPDVDPSGFAGPTYGSVLTIVRLMNDVGPGAVTPDAMRTALRSFDGPMWGVVGPMACGVNEAFPALCGVQVGIQRYVEGRWVSVRDGANGQPIDPNRELNLG
jgi:branched-chain amino acid transport system substrate-binding protein